MEVGGQTPPPSAGRPPQAAAKPGRGALSGLLPTESDWSANPPTATPPKTAPPDSPSTSPLDAAIDRLSKLIADRERYTEATIPPVEDLDRFLGLAADYQQRYELMRERLFISDPPAESAAGKAVAAFLARWGALGPRIWSGDRKHGAVAAPDWARLGPALRGRPCPIATPLPEPPPTGIVAGPVWACLSDAFFEDLARHEATTQATLSEARHRVSKPLGDALEALHEWIDRTEGLRRVVPESAELRRQLTWRLNRVWLTGARIRRDELITIRQAGQETPFDQFLAIAPAVVRPDEGSAPALLVRSGRDLRATLGEARARLRVETTTVADDEAGLARQLHDVHYRLRTLERRAEAVEQERLRDYAALLADELAADPALVDPRKSPRFREGMERKAAEYLAGRPARIAEARKLLEERRRVVLDKIAAR